MARSSTTFGPGNFAALKHGARSQRVRESVRKELAQSLRDQVRREVGEVLADTHPTTIDLLVDCLADVRQLRDWLNAQGGVISSRGGLYKAVETLRARERDAIALMDRMGMNAKSRAGLIPALGLATPKEIGAAQAQAELIALYAKREEIA